MTSTENKNEKSILRKIWKDPVFSNVTSGVILMVLGLIFISNDDVKQVVHELITPDVVVYSAELQNKAADEIESGMCPALSELAAGYLVMRDQTRFLKSGGGAE